MKKLLRGILDFRKNVYPERRETFSRLAAEGQSPDVLFITCSDSRVAPNWFASTDPGDLFVVRNVGNLVPPCDHDDEAEADFSVGAAMEFSVGNLQVSDIVVCGHSGCGAIHALAEGIEKLKAPNLKRWLKSADAALRQSQLLPLPNKTVSTEAELSQQSVLQQIENLKTYPKIRDRLQSKKLRLHAWWFNIGEAGVYVHDAATQKFVLIDEHKAAALLCEIK